MFWYTVIVGGRAQWFGYTNKSADEVREYYRSHYGVIVDSVTLGE